jgi:hypothetical protein
MSGARYTAVLDAWVLYPAPLRDLLLSLAHTGLYHARWTVRIQDDWVRNLLCKRPDLRASDLLRTRAVMNKAIPDCPQHPDDFLANQLDLGAVPAPAAVKAMRPRLRSPPRSAAELIATLERNQLPLTSSILRTAESLI